MSQNKFLFSETRNALHVHVAQASVDANRLTKEVRQLREALFMKDAALDKTRVAILRALGALEIQFDATTHPHDVPYWVAALREVLSAPDPEGAKVFRSRLIESLEKG